MIPTCVRSGGIAATTGTTWPRLFSVGRSSAGAITAASRAYTGLSCRQDNGYWNWDAVGETCWPRWNRNSASALISQAMCSDKLAGGTHISISSKPTHTTCHSTERSITLSSPILSTIFGTCSMYSNASRRFVGPARESSSTPATGFGGYHWVWPER